jgi:hypothetical protein
MTIIITPDIEQALAEEASKMGTTPQELALQCLRARFVPSDGNDTAAPEQGTLADFLAGHIGVLASGEHAPGGADMSQDSGKKFATGMVQKRARGPL